MNARRALVGLVMALLVTMGGHVMVVAQDETAPAGPYALGGAKHLFIDGFLIAEQANVTLTVNPPERKELVIIADKPWERGGITSYCNVFWDLNYDEYRLYYVPIDLESSPAFRLALATSKDGIHWDKPNLGVVEWKGSTENNIVIDGQREGTVMIDPNGTPERRYVFLSSEGNLKTRLFTSPDGIHWTMDPIEISGMHSDSQISTFWDEQLQKCVHYPRVGFEGRATGRVETSRMDEPWPAEIPVVLSRDAQDPPGVDLYTNSAQKYALAPNVYLAFPTPYYHYNEPGREYLNYPTLAAGGKTNDGVIETQLAVSRDGKTWTRYRTPYLPLYRHEDLDLKICMVFPGLIYHPTYIDQYTGNYAFTHGDTQARRRLEGRALGGIFRLEQRIDGFVSADFAYGGGSLTTEPLVFEGNCLTVNVNTSAAGEGRVAILDPEAQPIAGYGIEECEFINGDYLDKLVSWRGEADISALTGKPVRLRFEMRGAKLYSFQFAQRDPASLVLWEGDRQVEDPANIAPRARVTVSSAHGGGFDGERAVDGVVPAFARGMGEPQSEWASDGEGAGAWLQLDWDAAVGVAAVTLYDRPGPGDHVVAGTLSFSDGTTLPVGELPNDAKDGVTVEFAPKTVTWVRFTVEQVGAGCTNPGLSEIVVRGVQQ